MRFLLTPAATRVLYTPVFLCGYCTKITTLQNRACRQIVSAMTSRRLRQTRSTRQAAASSSPADARTRQSLAVDSAASASSSSSSPSSSPSSEDDYDPGGGAGSASLAPSFSDQSSDSVPDFVDRESLLDVPSPSEDDASDENKGKRRRAPAARRRAKRPKSDPEVTTVKVESKVAAFSAAEIETLRANLLSWYVVNCRHLPWRAPPRYRADAPAVHPGPPEKQSSAGAPYAVWVSEVMSQQTRLSVVVEYWKRWMAAFPTVQALAAAPLERVNELWSGLGYYRRAKFLHEGAAQIVAEYGGDIPESVTKLLKVKGIGKYTAGAVSSISFNNAVPAVDGNVERVLARMRPGILPNTAPTNTPGAKAKIYDELASALVADIECAGDFNQGLMELGATVCAVHNPLCESCPVQSVCGSHAEATASGQDPATYAKQFPVKDKSRKTKQRDETVLVCVVSRLVSDKDGAPSTLEYLLLQRPASGLLAGMWESPNVVLSSADAAKHNSARSRARLMDGYLAKLLPQVGVERDGAAAGRRPAGEAAHVFSHIKQRLLVECMRVGSSVSGASGTAQGVAFRWLPETEIRDSAVATQMRKALALAFVDGQAGAKPEARAGRARARKLRT